MRAINAASLGASVAMNDTASAVAGPSSSDAAREQLRRRLALIRTLQVCFYVCVHVTRLRNGCITCSLLPRHNLSSGQDTPFELPPSCCGPLPARQNTHPPTNTNTQVSHNERVSREMRGCLINGHVLAVPFSDGYRDALAAAVTGSGLHRTVDPRVKFAMAAYVERMGAAWVGCIWVYIAAVRETS